MKILEIGPGTADGKSLVFPDADTADIQGSGPTAKVELGQSPLPFADESYDLVFMSHILEHIPWYRSVTALREVHRVLKPGGELELYVPDFAFIVQCYQEQRCGDDWRIFNDAGGWMTWVNGRLFTYGEDATELLSKERPIPQTHHKAVFDEPYLLARLEDAGFTKVQALRKRRNGKGHGVREAGALGIKQ
jgi:ubiquinone/menaquinone biosynthesis C-methylase UbiE